MKKMKLLLTLAIVTAFMAGCGGSDEDETPTPAPVQTVSPTPEPEPTPEPTPVPEPTVDPHEGQALSKLTGEYIPEKKANRRPYAMMINNIEYAARFQSGVSQAAILYEAKVEGGITRLMAIFEDISKLSKIGSARSARHYYVSVADEYDAIYVHFGHTKFATAKIAKLGVDNISGLSGVGGKVFYRDNSISAPHNAFTSEKGLLEGRKTLKYRKNYKDGFEGHFKFYEADTDLQSEKIANKVTVKFSGYASPYFIYNADDKVYYRHQYGKEHMDVAKNKQLSFKNLIIQKVDDEPIVPGHRKDYRTINFEKATGKGWYITNGKAIKITWKKNESKGFMKYYHEDGTELVINPGKTYVALFPDEDSKLTISDKKK
ncbi:MAG: DUF3048 domain-containing protein [Lachnospiraceae bacterium]|nr:DUF3048 domain-containing protein [Lachnospiraceae bacterium]